MYKQVVLHQKHYQELCITLIFKDISAFPAFTFCPS